MLIFSVVPLLSSACVVCCRFCCSVVCCISVCICFLLSVVIVAFMLWFYPDAVCNLLGAGYGMCWCDSCFLVLCVLLIVPSSYPFCVLD